MIDMLGVERLAFDVSMTGIIKCSLSTFSNRLAPMFECPIVRLVTFINVFADNF
jgi:hypothetical protein